MKIIIDPFLNLFVVFFKLYSYVSNEAALIILIKQLGNNNCSFGLKKKSTQHEAKLFQARYWNRQAETL